MSEREGERGGGGGGGRVNGTWMGLIIMTTCYSKYNYVAIFRQMQILDWNLLIVSSVWSYFLIWAVRTDDYMLCLLVAAMED